MFVVQLIKLFAERGEQCLVLFVKLLLVAVHFDAALLLKLEEGALMLTPHPLVARHLLVHFLLHVLLLLLGHDRRCPNGGEVVCVVATGRGQTTQREPLLTDAAGTTDYRTALVGAGQRGTATDATRVTHQAERSRRIRAVSVLAAYQCGSAQPRAVAHRRRVNTDGAGSAVGGIEAGGRQSASRRHRRPPLRDGRDTAGRAALRAGTDTCRLNTLLRRDTIALAAVTAAQRLVLPFAVANRALRFTRVHHQDLFHLAVVEVV